MPLYHVLLKTPHKDKEIAEKLVAEGSTETGAEAPIDNFIIVRPTLLTNGPALGQKSVKTGWEKHPSAPGAVSENETRPAIGYTIRRADVGTWIFENAIKGGRGWAGKCVSMTY